MSASDEVNQHLGVLMVHCELWTKKAERASEAIYRIVSSLEAECERRAAPIYVVTAPECPLDSFYIMDAIQVMSKATCRPFKVADALPKTAG